MKKRFLVGLFVLFVSLNVFSLDKKDFSVSVTPEFGFLHGMLYEYLDIHSPQYNYSHRISQLNYNIDIPYVGLEIDSKLFKFIYFGGSITAGIPGKSGRCDDYDWQNCVFINYSDRDVLTNFSMSDNSVRNYLDARLALGLNLELPAKITVKPYASIEYADIYCDVNNLVYFYAQPRTTVNGDVMYYPLGTNHETIGGSIAQVGQYGQYYSTGDGLSAPTVGFGFKFSVQTFSFLDVRGTVGILPFLYYAGYDYHMLRNLEFLDITSTIKFYGNLNIGYKINKNHSVGVKCGITMVPKEDGLMYSRRYQSGKYSMMSPFVETACAAQIVSQISLFYTLTL